MEAQPEQGEEKDFTVAIVGGGMCGLTLAIALARSNIRVQLFEAAPKFGEVGAGVGIGPNAVRTLAKLGVLPSVVAHSGQTPHTRPFVFLPGYDEPDEGGQYEVIYDYEINEEDKGLPIHRATFLDALVPLLPPRLVRFNKRCINITRLDTTDDSQGTRHPWQIHFSDGSTHTADLVVGADGIRSTVRKVVLRYNERSSPSEASVDESTRTTESGGVLLGKERERVQDLTHTPDPSLSYTSWSAYRALIPRSALVEAGVRWDLMRSLCLCGTNQHIITFPVQNGKLINTVIFASNPTVPRPSPSLAQPWIQATDTASILQEFRAWNKDTRTLIGLMKDVKKWAIHAVDPPLGTYVLREDSLEGEKREGGMVLIGDAAHACTPHLGAGVGQGFEDVYVLWRLLAHPGIQKQHIPLILRTYDTLRVPHATKVLLASHAAGAIYESYRCTIRDDDGKESHTGDSEEQMRLSLEEARRADRKRMKEELVGMWEVAWDRDDELEKGLRGALESII